MKETALKVNKNLPNPILIKKKAENKADPNPVSLETTSIFNNLKVDVGKVDFFRIKEKAVEENRVFVSEIALKNNNDIPSNLNKSNYFNTGNKENKNLKVAFKTTEINNISNL